MKEKIRKYKNTKMQLVEKLSKLQKLINILDSDLKDYKKMMEMCRIYNSTEKFRSSYQLIYNFGKEDPMFKGYIERFDDIYSFYKKNEENGVLENVNYILSIEKHLDNYLKAEQIINLYINDFDSYKQHDFLSNLHITDKDFIFFTEVIKVLNPILYKKYEEKKELNKKVRFLANKKAIESLSIGIEKGFLEDGTTFNLLEFIKRIPFKENKNFISILAEFMEKNTPNEFKNIMRYIYTNKLNSKNFNKPLDINFLYSSKTIYKGRLLTKEDINAILKYMNANKIPLITKAYLLVREEYVDGLLNIDETNKQKGHVKQDNN